MADHLHGTAELAARFAKPFGGEAIAHRLGLFHDAGKASCAWQAGLLRAEAAGGRVGIDHKLLGAQLGIDCGLRPFALAIDGHHGGLSAWRDLRGRLDGLDPASRERNREAEHLLRSVLPELFSAGPVEIPDAWRADELVAEMALRLLFSTLCDADFLDTAAHFAAAPVAVRPDADFAALSVLFEHERKKLLEHRPAAAIDSVREEVYRECIAAAADRPGIYRLAAPTGAGKTLASAGFALHHAATHGAGRVIVAVPFLTITEQNAAVYRSLLDVAGAEIVLEHHSGVDLDSGQRWQRLAAENWDAPFVVTTTVRLFEALFGRKPAAMRRVHRLAGAVIILDEVQALPHRLLVPILDALRTLVEHFGTTVLLTSATQPDFWHLSPFRDLPAVDIIPKPAKLVAQLRRVVFDWRIDPSPTLTQVADEAAECGQALVVVNTTADAATVFNRWRETVSSAAVWQLSTRMCPDHRRRVLAAVHASLGAGEPTLLVSTQLIEAGVDVDFPVVYRTLAPADSLLQAAGRANREGNLGRPGRVVIVDPQDAGMPPPYNTLVNLTRTHFGPGRADPDDLDALRNYYRSVYGSLNLEGRGHLGQQIQFHRRGFDFPAVTDGPRDPITQIPDRTQAFRMIEDDSIAVVTPQAVADPTTRENIDRLMQALREGTRPERSWLRQLQPYVTTVHRSVLRQPGVIALLRPVIGEPGGRGGLAEWVGSYDPDVGIDLDPRPEEFIL
ncbi:CRISPR-associated helicase Cas3' [Rhodococcus xishaensis]|uniref:CRISPR-associated helicase Cas3 n=1 Tax=Rhodococcus xishaensis TaxID=2487364 RepID=A0A3S3CP33_9NOCA|nr:CRISPR-associated helicase Cas3' [Rhodococcus xishaensis]